MSEQLTFHNTNDQRDKGLQPTVLLERPRTGEIVTATATGQFDKHNMEYYAFVEDGVEKAKPLSQNRLSDQMQDSLAEQLAADRPLNVEQNEYEDTLPVVVKMGEAALDAVDVMAPDEHEQEAGSEQALLKAKNVFYEQFNRLSSEYNGVSNYRKNEIKTSVEDLSVMWRRLDESTEAAFNYLRSGVAQPERIYPLVNLAIDELTAANNIINTVEGVLEDGRLATGSLTNQADTYKGNVARLHGELSASMAQIVADTPEAAGVVLDQIDTEAGEVAMRQAADVNRLKDAVADIDTALRLTHDDTDAAQQRTRNLLGRLEEARASASQGRLNGSDYESIVRSAGVLAHELQETGAVRRLVSLAEDL